MTKKSQHLSQHADDDDVTVEKDKDGHKKIIQCEKCKRELEILSREDNYEVKQTTTREKGGKSLVEVTHVVGDDEIPDSDPSGHRSFASEGDPDAVDDEDE